MALAVLFRDCADLLKAELAAMKRPKWLPHPWMEDPVSKWAQRRFEKYFVEGEEALIGVVQAQHDQYADITRVLRETGRRYGLAEELAAAGFAEIGAAE